MDANVIFTDRQGRHWVSAEFLRKHFGIAMLGKKFFYDYDFWEAKADFYFSESRKARQARAERH